MHAPSPSPSARGRLYAIAASRAGSLALVVFAIVSIQIGASIAKRLFPLAGAPGTAALRLGFATVILWLLFRPWRAPVARGARLPLLVYGSSLGAMNLLFYLALRTVPQGLAVALEFTGPMAVSLLAARRPLDFLWVACALSGLLLLLPGLVGSAIDPAGAGFALAAGACWGLYMVYGQKAGGVHGVTSTAWGMGVAALLVVPVGVHDAGARLLDPALWPPALGIAVLSSALPYTIEMFALQHIPVRSFGILMSMEPALGAMAGLLLLDEHLGARQWLAIGAVITASLGTTLTGQRQIAAVASD
jgi:inner membrane transporter RhtA